MGAGLLSFFSVLEGLLTDLESYVIMFLAFFSDFLAFLIIFNHFGGIYEAITAAF